ncbi:hypothetical protein BKA93DRAFT_472786 [Sparassis latifolia]
MRFQVENSCLIQQRHGVKLERLTTEATRKFDTVQVMCSICVLTLLSSTSSILSSYVASILHLIRTVTVAFLEHPPPLKFLSNAARHTALQRIVLPCVAVHPDREFKSRVWLVALSDICLPPKFRWSHDEAALRHNPLRQSAERLLQHGVAFPNYEGRRWTRV